MRAIAFVIGIFIVVLGVIGVASPATFYATVAFFQDSPAIYLAAFVRLFVGAVLVLAASAARTPILFRILGVLILIGGIATLFVGERMGHAILDQWSSGGDTFVRIFGGGLALVIGPFITWSAAPRKRG